MLISVVVHCLSHHKCLTDREEIDHRLTINERINVVKLYYAAGGNISKTLRDFSESLHQAPPHPRTVKSIIAKFEATGSVVHAAGAERPVSVSTAKRTKISWQLQLQYVLQVQTSLSAD